MEMLNMLLVVGLSWVVTRTRGRSGWLVIMHGMVADVNGHEGKCSLRGIGLSELVQGSGEVVCGVVSRTEARQGVLWGTTGGRFASEHIPLGSSSITVRTVLGGAPTPVC